MLCMCRNADYCIISIESPSCDIVAFNTFTIKV